MAGQGDVRAGAAQGIALSTGLHARTKAASAAFFVSVDVCGEVRRGRAAARSPESDSQTAAGSGTFGVVIVMPPMLGVTADRLFSRLGPTCAMFPRTVSCPLTPTDAAGTGQ
jgi:hypothetical protein